MKILLHNPTTHELNEFQKLVDYAKEKYNSTFHTTFENEGYVFCHGDLVNDKGKTIASARTFMPIGSDLGKSRVLAEILSITQCLKDLGETIEWLEKEDISPAIVSPSAYNLTEEYLKGSSNLAEALRRVRLSGYPNYNALEAHLKEFKDAKGNRKRATKNDVITFIFSYASDTPSAGKTQITERKPLRSGIEWRKVKELVKNNVPEGYNSADEFATFASKSEVDGYIKLQDNKDN